MSHATSVLRITLEQMAGDAAGGDLFIFGGSTLQLQTLAEQEVRWLDDHPPDPCYAEVHAAVRRAFVELAAEGEQLTALADADDPAAISTADAALEPAVAAMDDATPLISPITAACGL